MQELIGRQVEVITTETGYTGILVEIGEVDVHIQSETGWIVIPMEKIVDIRGVD